MYLKEIVLAVPALTKLTSANLQLKTAYALKQIVDKLQKDVDFFNQERNKIVDKYGNVQNDGTIVIPEEYQSIADEEYNRLLSMDIDSDFSRLKIHISEDAKLSVNDLTLLSPFVDFVEDDNE